MVAYKSKASIIYLFTKQGQLVWEHNPINAPMRVESSEGYLLTVGKLKNTSAMELYHICYMCGSSISYMLRVALKMKCNTWILSVAFSLNCLSSVELNKSNAKRCFSKHRWSSSVQRACFFLLVSSDLLSLSSGWFPLVDCWSCQNHGQLLNTAACSYCTSPGLSFPSLA